MDLDCAIIGGGPAGLVAATYLARFRRCVAVLSAGPPRASWIPRTRNVPAYPEGLAGRDLLGRLRRQAARLGVQPLATQVTALARDDDAFVLSTADPVTPRLRARRVLLATGVEDRLPPSLAGQWGAVRADLARLCPVCDAFEHRDVPLLIIGGGEHGAHEALFLRAYSPDVRVLTDGAPGPDGALAAELLAAGVPVSTAPLARIYGRDRGKHHRVIAETRDGERWSARAVYIALGVRVRSELAAALGAERDAQGYLRCDAKQQTSVPGLYAAGDVVQSLSQISVAFGQAAIAASAIHQSLDPFHRSAPTVAAYPVAR